MLCLCFLPCGIHVAYCRYCLFCTYGDTCNYGRCCGVYFTGGVYNPLQLRRCMEFFGYAFCSSSFCLPSATTFCHLLSLYPVLECNWRMPVVTSTNSLGVFHGGILVFLLCLHILPPCIYVLPSTTYFLNSSVHTCVSPFAHQHHHAADYRYRRAAAPCTAWEFPPPPAMLTTPATACHRSAAATIAAPSFAAAYGTFAPRQRRRATLRAAASRPRLLITDTARLYRDIYTTYVCHMP